MDKGGAQLLPACTRKPSKQWNPSSISTHLLEVFAKAGNVARRATPWTRGGAQLPPACTLKPGEQWNPISTSAPFLEVFAKAGNVARRATPWSRGELRSSLVVAWRARNPPDPGSKPGTAIGFPRSSAFWRGSCAGRSCASP